MSLNYLILASGLVKVHVMVPVQIRVRDHHRVAVAQVAMAVPQVEVVVQLLEIVEIVACFNVAAVMVVHVRAHVIMVVMELVSLNVRVLVQQHAPAPVKVAVFNHVMTIAVQIVKPLVKDR